MDLLPPDTGQILGLLDRDGGALAVVLGMGWAFTAVGSVWVIRILLGQLRLERKERVAAQEVGRGELERLQRVIEGVNISLTRIELLVAQVRGVGAGGD